MRNFINLINEAFDDETYSREEKIEGLIRYAFNKIKLDINYNNFSVSYEDSTREAEVKLETPYDGFSLNELSKLEETGLSNEYKLVARNGDLVVLFKVDANLDDALDPQDR